jgi:MOSC domain-containing protein YiiM
MRVLRIFISPGHNFVGHFGRPAGRHPLLEVPRVECVAGMGLFGDRYFGHKVDYKGQVTLFSSETLEALQREFRLGALHPGVHRRNVLVEGVDLNGWIGREFEVQGVHFVGTEEAKPCLWMNEAIAPGAETWLRGRGGLRARVLSDGTLTSSLSPWPLDAAGTA